MVQPSLLVKAETPQVILPVTDKQVQVVRDTSAFGLGKYWAYFKNGTRELIGDASVIPTPGNPGALIQSGQFTFNTSQGTVFVPTPGGAIKLAFFNALYNSGGQYNSWGRDNMTNSHCNYSGPLQSADGDTLRDSSNSINISQNVGSGRICTAKITAITAAGFTLTIVPTVAAQVISVDWHSVS